MELFRWRSALSPLILAIIFITFFHNVLSRHRIRHFKDRFKRQQGAHLYLPGTFVTDADGVPESGPWEEWSDPSPCSRTCGGGVTTQSRRCTPGYECQGPSKKYFSCNTQDCPVLSDFRAQQCAEYDDILFEDIYYEWVPYTKSPNLCQLNCMPKGERFYFRHAMAVVDGTRCDDEKFDVCVSGKCHPVGCDRMLGSSAREDQCRVCGGDGTSCNTFTNRIEMKDMVVGYNDILLIPAGATNIRVEELAPSNNYLAIRNKTGHYYLNGNWRIDFPKSLDFAGCRFKYERNPQEFAAPDIITCLGPTEESLFFVLLYQDSDVPISYTYSLPTNVPPPSTETYAWTYDEFTPCSATCGGGYQFRNVTCAGRNSLEPVDRSLCDSTTEPEAKRRCAEIACQAQWVPYPWKECSAPCGEGGVQQRDIFCQQIVSNGQPTLADESECLKVQPKPTTEQKCNVGKVCAKWHAGPWKPCDHICGDGKQTRKVQCYIEKDHKIEILDDGECEAITPKPDESMKCKIRPCEGVDWITSEWTGCDRVCGLKNETRKVHCATAEGEIYPDELCEAEQPRPELVRKCDSSNATCQYLWYASQWSECSVTCGKGVQSRTVFCGVSTVDGVEKVENDKCDPSKHFETLRNCTGENEECEGEWFSGPWGKCSKPCGGGERTKKVLCIKDEDVVDPSACGSDKIIFSHEVCNSHPCSEDTIMPTDVTHPVDESEPTEETPLTTMETTTAEEMKSDITESTPAETTQSTLISPRVEKLPSELEEYEIVPDTNCDDGEWVEVPIENTEQQDEPIDDIKIDKEVSLMLDDLMMNDGPVIIEEEEGSGGYSTDFSSSTTDEGSGSESTIITDETSPSSTSDFTTESGITDSTVSGLTVKSTQAISETTTENKEEEEEFETLIESDIPFKEKAVPPRQSSSTVQFGTTEFTGTTEEFTGSTESTIEFTGSTTESTGSTGSEITEQSTSSTTEFTGSTTEYTDSTVGGSTESPSDISEKTTDSAGSTEFTGSTDGSTVEFTGTTPEFTGSSETATDLTTTGFSGETEYTGSTSTESSTELTGSTTEFTGSTEVSGSTEGSTDISGSTTEFTGSTEASGSTEGSTEISGSTTEFTSSTEVSGSTEGSTEMSGSTTEFTGSTEVSGTTERSTEMSGSTTEFTGSTEVSGSTEGSTEISSSTTEFTSSTEVSGSTEGSTEISGSTTGFTSSTEVSGSTEGSTEISESTTEFTGSTEVSSTTEGSTEISGSTTEFTDSTETSSSTESSSELASSTTEITGSTEISSSTEYSTGSTKEFTGSTTEFTGSTTEFTGSTTETSESDIFTSTTESGITEESTYSYLYGTTPITDIFKKTRKMCKRRKVRACRKTEFGCCWDNITPAKGPFDKGCPTPQTCKESKFGCCEDGVSPALGTKFAGCPSSHCNETLFGCCPDNKTVSEGNDYEGCPPACLVSKYGCCEDNITEATGPEHEGCEETETTTTTELTTESTTEFTTESSVSTEETVSTTAETTTELMQPEDCNNTTFRCCPDGVTTATGPGFQGCNLPCSNSTFGCCQDGQTSAHGPSGEGCCLSSPFGCCPDNIVPARGLNKEGCECENSPYGCCPDNRTSAQGYNQEGCGCQGKPFGCCPDNVATASGPDFQGCLCHTFQFGCCPDGVSIAKGPQDLGCGCRFSKFGCCSDEKTSASGPNMEGCGCENSKYGCCIDGVTEAKGENFEGCESRPQNLQIGCSLPKERGTCRDFKVKWFFDMDYGGCSRFWYGGCDGNENRYNSKEECENICVKPQATDRCNLPKVMGPCEGYYPLWYYDKELKNCAQFVYGGCLGNNNKFETREDCTSLCVKDSSADPCEQTKEEGPCHGQYQRYYYDQETSQCMPFIYGGCKGNYNNFPTIEACNQKCAAPGVKKDYCSLPEVEGNCTETLPRWYSSTSENRCVPFYYTGCNGNQNNFETKEACENDCPKEVVKDTCQLPAEVGDCANYVERWYYDTREKGCRQFYYGGCGGNANNFESLEKCQGRCENLPPVVPQPAPEPTSQPPSQSPAEPFRTEMCFLPSETGPCRAAFTKYFYDSTDGVCKTFVYGGCNGNRNNFESQEECLQYCGNSQDFCTLPPVVGPCDNKYVQYYYEPTSDSCRPFEFGGCGGNYNRFQDQASCEVRCKKGPSGTQAPPVPTDMCNQPADSGNCSESNVAFFYDKDASRCTPFTYTGCGGNDNRFNSEEQCERQCGIFKGEDVCNMERDVGPCNGYFVKYFYDKQSRRCTQFAYGGCQGNGNRFSSSAECEHICVTHEESKPNITNTAICQLQVDQGSCQGGYHKRWYFDDERGECRAFIYSGCGGNFNNFKSYQSCLDFCRELLPKIETQPPEIATDMPPHPCQEVFDECTSLRCAYGVEPFIDKNECNRCRCHDPCIGVECPEDEQCAIDLNSNRTTLDASYYVAICRKRVKPGSCLNLEMDANNCEEECRTDADCSLHYKCCPTSCGTACVEPPPPAQLVTQQPEPAYTDGPVVIPVQPPRVDPIEYKPEVTAPIGDQAVLTCAVSGNPNPRISWSKDNIEIDGTQPRYRIKLDQSLQIITLHKTDSGIYLCTADNGIGDPITNQIRLDVLDSGPKPATILDGLEDQPPLIVSLNAPTTLNCYGLGNPFPVVTWWKDDSWIPFENNEMKVRSDDNSLLIHSVKLHNLGIYTCQAYNGYGKAASWSVTVKARGPYHFTSPKEMKYKQYIVDTPEEPTSSTSTTTSTTIAPPPPPPLPSRYPPYIPRLQPFPPFTPFTEPSNEIIPGTLPNAAGEVGPTILNVPVRANITTSDQRYPVGSKIEIPCLVTGYPLPQVQWYKDGIQLSQSEKIQISDFHTLTILQATKADSGYYQCEATNQYTKASSTLEILVEGMYIHPSCTDNPFFANCALIVKAKYCSHKYYGKFCCRSCTEAGLLPTDGSHLFSSSKQNAIDTNFV